MKLPTNFSSTLSQLAGRGRSLAITGALLLLAVMAPRAAHAVPVDLELALLVDVSGSVSTTEFNTQRDGYVSALTSQAFLDAVTAGNYGQVAITFMYWSGASQQSVAVGWTLIHDSASATAFANAISAAARPFSGLTAPGSAINAIVPTFASNGFEGTFQKIDVSGDGTQNDGANTAAAVQNALLAGIDQINGLPIGNQALVDWYTANILGGAGAFNQPAASFSVFQPALLLKLEREVTESSPVPEPSSFLLFGGSLVAAAWLRKRYSKS